MSGSKIVVSKAAAIKNVRKKNVINHETLLQLFISSLKKPMGFNETVPLHEIIRYSLWDRFVLQGASPFLVREYTLNDVWQPFAGGLTGSMSGYNSSAFRYALFKVISSIIKVMLTSNENFGMSFYFIVSDTQPSTLITTYALALKYGLSSNIAFTGTVGYSTGGSRFVSKPHKVMIADVVANSLAYYGDNTYGGSLGTPLIAVPVVGVSPNQKIWGALVLVSDVVGQNLTNGAFCDVQLRARTLNYSVRIDA